MTWYCSGRWYSLPLIYRKENPGSGNPLTCKWSQMVDGKVGTSFALPTNWLSLSTLLGCCPSAETTWEAVYSDSPTWIGETVWVPSWPLSAYSDLGGEVCLVCVFSGASAFCTSSIVDGEVLAGVTLRWNIICSLQYHTWWNNHA